MAEKPKKLDTVLYRAIYALDDVFKHETNSVEEETALEILNREVGLKAFSNLHAVAKRYFEIKQKISK